MLKSLVQIHSLYTISLVDLKVWSGVYFTTCYGHDLFECEMHKDRLSMSLRIIFGVLTEPCECEFPRMICYRIFEPDLALYSSNTVCSRCCSYMLTEQGVKLLNQTPFVELDLDNFIWPRRLTLSTTTTLEHFAYHLWADKPTKRFFLTNAYKDIDWLGCQVCKQKSVDATTLKCRECSVVRRRVYWVLQMNDLCVDIVHVVAVNCIYLYGISCMTHIS